MYIMYLARPNNVIKIRRPESIVWVWIAVVKDDGTTFIPKEVDNPKFDESYARVQHETFEGLVDLAIKNHKELIYGHHRARLLTVAKQALEEWTIPGENSRMEYGATCKKCSCYNEYALSTNDFICTSCKSYDEMYT